MGVFIGVVVVEISLSPITTYSIEFLGCFRRLFKLHMLEILNECTSQ
jgi:hypothetical protein